MADTKSEEHNEEETWTLKIWETAETKPITHTISGVKPGESIATIKKRIVEHTHYPHGSFDLAILGRKDTEILDDESKLEKKIGLSLFHHTPFVVLV